MNLYDRAILETRLKRQKKEESLPKLSQQMHSARHLTERKLASSRSQLDHTSKHFFIWLYFTLKRRKSLLSHRVTHLLISSLTYLNFAKCPNIAFPMISYSLSKRSTTWGISSALYSSMSLFSKGKTFLYSNWRFSSWMNSRCSVNLFTKYILERGREYRIPWHKNCIRTWIYTSDRSFSVHFSAFSLISALLLLMAAKMLLQMMPKLF